MPQDRRPEGEDNFELNLERELREAGGHVEYPPTPDLSGAVRRRLEAEAPPRSSGSDSSAMRWVAAAVVILLLGVPILASALNGGPFGGGAGGGAAQGGGAGAGGGAEAGSEQASGNGGAQGEGQAT